MIPLSVVIITYNESANIGRCIRSVRAVADEIIVLDSFSTDNTANIARSLGAIVYQEKFRGYIGQKNYALELASNNYVLSLDADEALDEKLIGSILEAKKNFHARAYYMHRRTNFCGHFITHGAWYPDRKVRLFDKRVAAWGGVNPHDRVEINEAFKPVFLKGDILHYSFDTIDDFLQQNNRLSTIAASSLFIKGKKTSWLRLLIHPSWAFFNGYILRRGFLDGADGYYIAVHHAHYVFQKHSKLIRLWAQKKKQEHEPVVKSIKTARKQSSHERKN
jgi:glycosyltransferase involved in cell wall biosynthesis